MTEALIADLGSIHALRVISRTTMMRYKGSPKSLPEIAQDLKVDAVVEGSVPVPATGCASRPSWSTPQEQGRFVAARRVNPQAYDLYLRGVAHAKTENRADNERAIDLLERSIACLAIAHAEPAWACVHRFFLFTPGEKHWEEKASAAVEKALALEPDLAEAWRSRGRLPWTPAHRFPHEQAIQAYQRAIALNPNVEEVYHEPRLVYTHMGLLDQAIQMLEKELWLNPANYAAKIRLGQALLYRGKTDQALAILEALPKDVNPSLAGYHTAWTLFQLGKMSDAAARLDQLRRAYPEDTGGVFAALQAMLHAAAGEGG